MYPSCIGAVVLCMASISFAHMEMIEPAPLRSRHNKHAGGNVDYDMISPLDAHGSDFPCKGALALVGTAQGGSVADYVPGQKYEMTIDGQAIHDGGSCQASLSFDKGKSWTVIHSYIGKCPSGTGKTSYPFAIPADAPSGNALFAWSWFNKIGNREMYMNCAVVTIKGGNSKTVRGTSGLIGGRPQMFVANIGNGCSTMEGKDLMFPDLGPDVSTNSQNTALPPEAKCAKSSKAGEGGGGNDGGKPDGDNGGKPSTDGALSDDDTMTTPTVHGGIFIANSATIDSKAPTTTADVLAETPQPTEEHVSTTVSPDVAEPLGANGDNTVYPAGTSCDMNGIWNCIGGTQFQRCASGAWSALQSVPAGTKCVPGVMQDIVIA